MRPDVLSSLFRSLHIHKRKKKLEKLRKSWGKVIPFRKYTFPALQRLLEKYVAENLVLTDPPTHTDVSSSPLYVLIVCSMFCVLKDIVKNIPAKTDNVCK